MKRITLPRPGGLDQLHMDEAPHPGEPGPGQVQVCIHASSLNTCEMRSGMRNPASISAKSAWNTKPTLLPGGTQNVATASPAGG